MTAIRSHIYRAAARLWVMNKKSHAKGSLDLSQQFEQLNGYGGIQHGGGFICHDELRFKYNGPGNGHPLALPSGQLVRIPAAERFSRR